MTEPIKILIVGNGFGGIYALKNLRKLFQGDKRVKISLIGEKNYFLFTPLLHEVATGGINPSNIIEPIREVLGCSLDKFYLGTAEEINLKNKKVKVGDNFIDYDYLILAPGSETNFYNTKGAENYSFTLKSIEDAVKIKNRCIAQIEHAAQNKDREQRKKMLKFVIVGGGPTGVELAAEIEELIKESFSSYYPKEIIEDVSIVLIQKGTELVPAFSAKSRQKSLAVLQKKGIEVILDSEVIEVADSYIVINKETKILTENVIWVAGVKPKEIKFDELVLKSQDGRLIVNEYLQLEDHREIFAIGDAALVIEKGKALPSLAQVAEKESLSVAKNIQFLINQKRPERFTYKSSGNLLSLGRWMAIGEIHNFYFSGHITWWFWRTVYLFKLISWRKKVKVALDWTINFFSPRDISQI
jgi:NADH dehydrogenase